MLLVDPAAVGVSAVTDMVGAETAAAATVGSSPVLMGVLPPGIDSTSVMAQMAVMGHAAMGLQMLAQFHAQRALFASAKGAAAGCYTATEGINAAAAALG